MSGAAGVQPGNTSTPKIRIANTIADGYRFLLHLMKSWNSTISPGVLRRLPTSRLPGGSFREPGPARPPV